MHRHLRYKVDV
jgi:hypothetical protein